ncbi:MAG: hypothetical protein GAK30_01371 [Paracidovorax wautersii]|uniref:ImpA N-terminal domain-containing protein n=1 Tax=Paracidovorax wautersii TaxID=1177982 RepID=A0A7V8JR30_9BURK|nr:MAG: hypothetical protein GAK30_01371 [Paracidovorax wautersii]
MSSDTLFDLNALLQPIAGEQPSGPDMLLTTAFDDIQNARRQEDASLDQGEWVADRKEADLPFVIRRCTELLRDQTKDLRLAIWLTDAAGGLRGLHGLAEGYRLLDALTAAFWDTIHPQPEDGDMDSRIGNIGWLLTRTIDLVRHAPLLQVGTNSISLLAWQSAVALDQSVRRHPSDADDLVRGKVTLDDLERIRSQAPASQLRALAERLANFQSAIQGFESTLVSRMGDDAPSFGAVRDALADLQHLARRFGAEPAETSATTTADAPAQVSAPTMAPLADTIAAPGRRGIQTRADAIELLQQVAQFFERTEPSSPAAYMAQKAATWAQLPLHEWLKHVVKSDDELSQLEEMLGVTRHARVERDS